MVRCCVVCGIILYEMVCYAVTCTVCITFYCVLVSYSHTNKYAIYVYSFVVAAIVSLHIRMYVSSEPGLVTVPFWVKCPQSGTRLV